MKTKTWPYGTEYKAEVMTVNKMLMAVHCPEIDEGFMLIGHGIKKLPKEGEIGKIIFTKGGPTGGYWQWQPASPPPGKVK